MAIIANAEVRTLAELWSGEVRSGTHQFITDKPESFGVSLTLRLFQISGDRGD